MATTLRPAAAPAPPPPPPSPAPLRQRIRPRDFTPVDAGLIAVSLATSLSIVWIVFDQLTLLSGFLGFLVSWIVVFLAVYWLVNRQLHGRRVAADRFVGALVTVGMLCMITPLTLLIGFLFVKGVHLLSVHVFVATQYKVTEICSRGRACPKPGLAHAIVGTFEQVGLAVLMGVPAAILTAIFLNEVGGRFTQAVRVIVTAMSGVPAIVAGVFIYSMWVVTFGMGFSGFAGSLALAILLLPAVTRGTEEVLKIVPNDLREASAALGAPQWRTVWSVVLPTARSGILTSVLLGIAVALGETAPLLFTVFGSKLMNANPVNGPQASLPLLIYEEIKSSAQVDINLGYTAALVLFLLVFLMFVLARVLGSSWLSRGVRSRMNKKMGEAATRGAAGGIPTP